MESVKEHYERLLARHYTWMFGKSFEAKVAEQKGILEEALELAGAAGKSGLAVDLGCGPGYQTIALAQLGFSPVVAVDTSAGLLDELRAHAGGLPIRAVEDDILYLERYATSQSAQAIVCMGDTITHLESRAAVHNLLQSIFKALAPGGALIITYRDLSNELRGVDRFIPVHSDDDRVMTCFLEFDQDESVTVHDLVYTRQDSGWHFEKSSYRKLRISAEWLESAMSSVGFEVNRSVAGGMVRFIGNRP